MDTDQIKECLYLLARERDVIYEQPLRQNGGWRQTYVNSGLKFVLGESPAVAEHLATNIFADSGGSVKLKEIVNASQLV